MRKSVLLFVLCALLLTLPAVAAAEGMDYGELCEKIIEVSLKKYKK